MAQPFHRPTNDQHPSSATRGPRSRMRRSWPATVFLLFAGMFFNAAAVAQSATNFNTKTLTPKAPAPKAQVPKKEKNTAPATSGAGPASAIPSRYVSEADLDAYVASLTSVFSMRNRTTDPFGQLQDPDAKPIIKTSVAKATRRVMTVQATPFSDIVRLLKVTTIMPGEKRFLLGTRSFKQGERISLLFRGKNINAEIISVGSRQIDFRNRESGETASLKIELLPLGMTPGTRGITAPGMAPDRPNAPIDLDNASPSNNATQNR